MKKFIAVVPDSRFLLSITSLCKFLKSKDTSLGLFLLRAQQNNPSSSGVGSIRGALLFFKRKKKASTPGVNIKDSFGDTLQSTINKVLKHAQMSKVLTKIKVAPPF